MSGQFCPLFIIYNLDYTKVKIHLSTSFFCYTLIKYLILTLSLLFCTIRTISYAAK